MFVNAARKNGGENLEMLARRGHQRYPDWQDLGTLRW